MTEQEIRQIIRDEIKQLLIKLLNNAWEKVGEDDNGCYIYKAKSAGNCIEQTLQDYLWEDNND